MRRAIAILTLAAGALLLVQGVSAAKPGIGQGPCHHGNSNKTCKPDPQPSHGKDCQTHGKNGGGNQDHCLQGGTVTPTPTPSPSGGGTTVGGVTKTHPGTHVKGVTLSRTGPQTSSVFAGSGLLLLGFGLLLNSFVKKAPQV